MQLEHRARVPADPERVWAFLMDVPKMAGCLPGAENVVAESDDAFRGALRVRVGPIALRLEGRIIVVERDDAAHRAAMRAEAADKRVNGAVRATMGMSLVELSPAETEIVINSDVAVMGKLGEFGQPLIRKKADEMMGQFAANLSKALQAAPAG